MFSPQNQALTHNLTHQYITIKSGCIVIPILCDILIAQLWKCVGLVLCNSTVHPGCLPVY